MYDIYDLILCLPLVFLGVYWWRASEQKRIAVAGARAYCRERGLQLLDETLVFRHLRLERESRVAPARALPAPKPSKPSLVRLGLRRQLCRVYEFDYSRAGEDRNSGEIVLSGYRILRVILHSEVLEITNYQ
ncbi:MAG TPA: DUF3301 domain-containing protein [Hyphomicrobiales bacterium]|nr:DUF3301 domain-containing protein [Hyphomicrobiales bacterium]